MTTAKNGITELMSDVRAFHRACDIPIADGPKLPGVHRLILRADLIYEESGETIRALGVLRQIIRSGSTLDDEEARAYYEEVADGLVDTIYVCIGAALELGIPLDRVWTEVQAANMRKGDGPVREDGKKLKPPGWVGPDVHGAIFGKAAE